MPLSSRKSAWLAAGTTPCRTTHSLRSPRSSSSFSTSHFSRLAHVGAVLEVILENLRGQRGWHPLALRFDGADHLSAADDLGGREPGNFRWQHQANFQL